MDLFCSSQDYRLVTLQGSLLTVIIVVIQNNIGTYIWKWLKNAIQQIMLNNYLKLI